MTISELDKYVVLIRPQKTISIALEAIELLVKIPSIELPSGQVRDWVESMRKKKSQEQNAIFQEAYSLPVVLLEPDELLELPEDYRKRTS